jgi:electron transfer flavoprotein beta subunit
MKKIKIIIFFKIVHNYDYVLHEDWLADDRGRVDVSYAPEAINYFDESALELALRLKERHPGISVTAATVGKARGALLKNLLALDFDEVVHIPGADTEFFPARVAGMLASSIEEDGDVDLVFTGSRAGAGDNGLVPLLCAERLGWPCLTQVTSVDIDADAVRVQAQTDAGALHLGLRPPAVLAFGNVSESALRVPTLKQKLAAKDRTVTVREVLSPAPPFPAPAVIRLYRDAQVKTAKMLEGDMSAKAEALYARIEAALAGRRV